MFIHIKAKGSQLFMFINSKTKCSLQDKSQSFIIIINTKAILCIYAQTVRQTAVSVTEFIYQQDNTAFYQIYSINTYVHSH